MSEVVKYTPEQVMGMEVENLEEKIKIWNKLCRDSIIGGLTKEDYQERFEKLDGFIWGRVSQTKEDKPPYSYVKFVPIWDNWTDGLDVSNMYGSEVFRQMVEEHRKSEPFLLYFLPLPNRKDLVNGNF